MTSREGGARGSADLGGRVGEQRYGDQGGAVDQQGWREVAEAALTWAGGRREAGVDQQGLSDGAREGRGRQGRGRG